MHGNYQLLASLQFRVIRYYETVYESFGNKLYRQLVGIPMGTNCAPVVADLSVVVFCYEIDFLTSLSNDDQADIILII